MIRIFQIVLCLSIFIACDKNGEIPQPQSNIPVVRSEVTYDVVLEQGITYAEGLSHQNWNSNTSTSMELKLDAFVPDNDVENRPAILVIHGGAYSAGSRTDLGVTGLANYFAKRGWVAFSIDYRLLGDKGTVPAEWIEYAENITSNQDLAAELYKVYPAIRDTKAAMRWIVANADSYGINTGFITVGGGSAGAVTAAALGITNLEDYTEEITVDIDPTLATTNQAQSYKVATILDFWGDVAGVELLEKIHGHQRFDSEDAPILIAHGDNDEIVPFSSAEELRDKYLNTGVDYAYYPLIGYPHSPWNATVDGENLGQLSFDFMVDQQNLTVE